MICDMTILTLLLNALIVMSADTLLNGIGTNDTIPIVRNAETPLVINTGTPDILFPENNIFRSRTAELLQVLCPGGGVCSSYQTGVDSCCGQCSCDVGCEVEGNCCFSNRHTVGVGELSKQRHSECLYPLTGPFTKYQVNSLYLNSYNMINSSPGNMTTVSCGDQPAAMWGSLYPVYSKSDGKIYKNKHCAAAHNASDLILWNPYVSCFGLVENMATNINSLYIGRVPEYCYVWFKYPGAITDIKSDTCYLRQYFEQTCPYREFSIDKRINLSPLEIMATCFSSLLSPYRTSKGYFVNVFCYICNRGKLPGCLSDNQTNTNVGNSPPSFTALLDMNYIDDTTKNSNSTQHTPNWLLNDMACKNKSSVKLEEECRRILCPAGQYRNRSHVCVYPGDKWQVPVMKMSLVLIADQPISLTAVSSIDSLDKPLSAEWKIDHIYISKQSNYKIAVVANRQSKLAFKPSVFFQNLEIDLTKPWYVSINGRRIKLISKFSKIADLDAVLSIPKSSFRRVFNENVVQIGNGIFITELYFCNQVGLQKGEFVYHRNNGSLWNQLTNKMLLSGEFSLMESQGSEYTTVCLDQSGLQGSLASQVVSDVTIYIHVVLLLYIELFLYFQ